MDISLKKECAKRRKRLRKNLGNQDILVCFSATLQHKSHDTHFPFRQNSNFYYLTGLDHSEGVLVLTKKEEKLYIKEKSAFEIKWEGESPNIRSLKKYDWCQNIDSFQEFNLKVFSGFNHLIFPWFNESDQSMALWKSLTSQARRNFPRQCSDIDPYLASLRKVKTSWEIKQIRKSCKIAKESHQVLREFVQVGKTEKECADFIAYEFKKRGAQGLAYDTIMASGNNANTLHYTRNNQTLKKGDLLLVDAGCNYNYYASDITRTYPIDGEWTKEQKLIHDLVEKAKGACTKMVRSGLAVSKLQIKSKKVLAQGLIDLGIFKGSLKQVLESSQFREVYPHGLGHSLGLDVHDIYRYPKAPNDYSIKLEESEVMTIEPGLYFHKNNKSIPKEFRGIGVRLEDDILVTKSGFENLTD